MTRDRQHTTMRRPDAGRVGSLIGLGAVLLATLAGAWGFRHYVNDDAYITFRYSRSWAEGRGPYFNVDEHVEGYTNFLWMAILTGVIVLSGPEVAPAAAKLMGVACGALTVVAVFCLQQRIRGPGDGNHRLGSAAGITAAGLLAVAPGFLVNTTSGLETSLFALAITVGLLLGMIGDERGRWRGAGLAFAAAALTRPEGGVIFLASAIVRLGIQHHQRNKSARWVLLDGGIVAAALLAHLVFRQVMYDGSWLPNTYYAKSGGFWKIDAWNYVWDGLAGSLGGAIGIVAAGFGWALRKDRWAQVAPVAAVALVGVVLPFVTGTDWMPGWRMMVPFLPCWVLLVATGWQELFERGWPRYPALAGLATVLLVPAIWMLQGASRTDLMYVTKTRAQGYRQGHEALAQWIRGETKPGETIALMDIGIVGYRCFEQRILDVSGLTDRHIARSPGGFLRKQYDAGYVLDQRPTIIVLVLTPDGPLAPLPEGVSFRAWTPMEERIWKRPDFQRLYRAPTWASWKGGTDLAGLAKALGAQRVFRHLHPSVHYYLAAFRLRDRAENSKIAR